MDLLSLAWIKSYIVQFQELYNRPPVTRVVSDTDAKIVRPQQIIVPSTHTETVRDTRPPTTYKPQLITKKAVTTQQQPLATTFHPPKTLATIFTRLPAYSAPGKAFQVAVQAAAPTTTVAKPTTTTTASPTTSTTTTTTTTTPKPPPTEKYSSHFNAHNLPLTPHLQQQPAPMRHNVKDLLASIGLTAEVTTQRPASVELTDDMHELLRTFGLLTNEQPAAHFSFDPDQHQHQQTPFGFDADSLYDLGGEQEEFLPIPSYQFHGSDDANIVVNEANGIGGAAAALLPDLEPTSVTKNYRMHDAPDPSAGDYFAFKPLPSVVHDEFSADIQHHGPASVNADMEAFLRSYGLLDGVNRNKKSIDAKSIQATPAAKITTTTTTFPAPTTPSKATLIRRMDHIPDVQVDFLSPQLLNVLGNLGIANNGGGRNRSRVATTVAQQATRRSDEIEILDDQNIYAVETTKATQSAKPSTPEEVEPTKMYPVFKPDFAALTTIETKPARATVETKPTTATAEKTTATAETKAAPNKRSSISTSKTTTIDSTAKPTVHIVLPTNAAPQTHQLSTTMIQSVSAIGKPDATPSLSEAASDYAKLQFLLATVKKLDQQNGTLSDADLELLDVNKLNLSQTLMRYSQTLDGRPTQAALDPLRESELLSVAKNEVKRQSGETTSPADAPLRFTLDLAATTETTKPADSDDDALEPNASSSTSTTSSTATTTTTARSELLTKEVETANGLEDSFPGGLDPVTEEPLPPPRRNGFYFFADWNSFLEVGEDPDKVVVRFDPKIGDPSRFIPIP